MDVTGIRCVAPSRVGVGEAFDLKIKVTGAVIEIPCRGQYNVRKPGLRSPFNRNVERGIQYHDNVLPAWEGALRVDGGPALEGDCRLGFDGVHQGVFPGDTRPIRVFPGFRFNRPGIHFIRLIHEGSGVESWANPVCVTAEPPVLRVYWGDPHWQTFFSDGIRCPEELYAFARDEAFLDFGALSDHMEAVTDRQWDYFQAVTNDYNAPGRFATLQGQEWTNHNPKVGAPGHRNIYYRGEGGPVLRSTAPDCDTLEKLWARLDQMQGIRSVAIPHHSANVVMGVDWDLGWNPKYEKAVEICSVWGSSECHAGDGNIMPIESLKGEMRGRHVVDALKRGYRLGFVGGGDIHDGRPGEAMHSVSYPAGSGSRWPSGLTAVLAPTVTREAVFDALCDRATYAATQRGIYLDVRTTPRPGGMRLQVDAACEDGIRQATVVHNGQDAVALQPDTDSRVIRADELKLDMASGDFCYVRIVTECSQMAWSSPVWADAEALGG